MDCFKLVLNYEITYNKIYLGEIMYEPFKVKRKTVKHWSLFHEEWSFVFRKSLRRELPTRVRL